MQSSFKITARDFELSDSIKEEIRQRAEKLERYAQDIVDCEVAVEAPVGHHRKGGPYTVRIDLQVKGAELAVSKRHDDDLQTAIHDAFDAARRQLQDHAEHLQRKAKAHEPGSVARVTKLFREGGYGFIAAADGREIYFHRNSVLGQGFDALEVGTEVRFDDEMGVEGPQATSVKAVDNYTDTLEKL